jgi:uncharacterized NAD(P)/FAD-binding protein YdhS
VKNKMQQKKRKESEMSEIIIVGGGLSGRLLALNLLRQTSSHASVSIRIIDRGGKEYLGPAYSNDSSVLLLNVRADQMGAFSEDPEHFYKWAINEGYRAEPGAFLPRKLCRDYIFSFMRKAVQARSDKVTFEHGRGEVIDLQVGDPQVTIHLQGRSPIATGREYGAEFRRRTKKSSTSSARPGS